jgi:hypothetical protein
VTGGVITIEQFLGAITINKTELKKLVAGDVVDKISSKVKDARAQPVHRVQGRRRVRARRRRRRAGGAGEAGRAGEGRAMIIPAPGGSGDFLFVPEDGSIRLRRIGSISIRRERWALTTAPLKQIGLRGVCFCRKKGRRQPLIVVSTHLGRRALLRTETILHEVLHALFPDLSERRVEKAAHSLAAALAAYEPRRRRSGRNKK